MFLFLLNDDFHQHDHGLQSGDPICRMHPFHFIHKGAGFFPDFFEFISFFCHPPVDQLQLQFYLCFIEIDEFLCKKNFLILLDNGNL